jgi:hypothetical protein
MLTIIQALKIAKLSKKFLGSPELEELVPELDEPPLLDDGYKSGTAYKIEARVSYSPWVAIDNPIESQLIYGAMVPYKAGSTVK